MAQAGEVIDSQRVYQALRDKSPDRAREILRSLPGGVDPQSESLLEKGDPGARIVVFTPVVLRLCSGEAPAIGAPVALAVHRYAVEQYEQTEDHAQLVPTSLTILAASYANASSLLEKFDDVLSFTEQWIPYYSKLDERENLPALKAARISALMSVQRLADARDALNDPTLRGNPVTDTEIARLEKLLTRLEAELGRLPDSTVESNAAVQQQRVDLDEAAFFQSLSPSASTAVAHAEAMRGHNGLDRVHMEHVVLGLYLKRDGPTHRLVRQAGIDENRLRVILSEAAKQELPTPNQYSVSPLSNLPPHSPHVHAAFIAARDDAAREGKGGVHSHNLLSGVLSVQECAVTRALRAHIPDTTIVSAAASPAIVHDTIAGYSDDSATGADQLDIEPEVNALCSVLVAHDVPLPISVGLFGDWGSGKSFFMQMMCNRIHTLKTAVRERLKREAKEGVPPQSRKAAFCANVVQIWFNAWHYMDTNLWASLGSEVFEKLNRAIKEDEDLAAGQDPVQVRARLLAAAASSRDVLAEAESVRAAAQGELEASQASLDKLKQAENDAAARLKPVALATEVYKKITQDDPKVAAQMQQAAEKLGVPTARAAATDLKAQLLELQGIVGYARATSLYLRERPVALAWLLAALVMGLAVLLVLPRLSLTSAAAWVARITGIAVASSGVLQPVLRYVRPAMQLLESGRKAYEDKITAARDAALKQAAQQNEAIKRKVTDAQLRVEAAEAALNDIEEQLDALRADQQLNNFIRDRQASTDYTQHLGLVARARRDFQQLSDLLGRARAEAGTAETGQSNGRRQPVASVDRIVLYIDDLDRCPESKVVDVLQAVHLLLALPLFVVVVGVDPRWLVHSLKQYSKAFGKDRDTDSEEEELLWESTPLNYLEKIFQIPFTLRPIERNGFGRMIDSISARRAPGQGAADVTHQQPSGPSVPAPPATSPGATTGPAAAPPGTPPPPPPPPPPQAPAPAIAGGGHVGATTPVELNPDFLQLKDWEWTFMKGLHGLIPSPRAAKRFVNIYRLIRATASQERLEALVGEESWGDYRAVQLLLAIQTGFPDPAVEILKHLMEDRPQTSWWEFFDTFAPQKTVHEGNAAQQAEKWQALFDRIEPLRQEIGSDDSCEALIDWAPSVARYSFQSGRVLLYQRNPTDTAADAPPVNPF